MSTEPESSTQEIVPDIDFTKIFKDILSEKCDYLPKPDCSENVSFATNDEKPTTSSSESSEKATNKRSNYNLLFKKIVIEYAMKENIRRAAIKFNVPRSCVQTWIKNKDQIDGNIDDEGRAFKKRLGGGGRPLKNIEFEKKMEDWLKKQQENNVKLSRRMIQLHAASINTDSKFATSNGWLESFLKRHCLLTSKHSKKFPQLDTESLTNSLVSQNKTKDLLNTDSQ